MEVFEFWQRKGWSSLTAGLSQRFSGFFPWKSKFWNFDNIENWKRFDFTQKMARKLKNFTLSHRKVLVLENEQKILDIWTTLPPEIHQKKFSDSLRIYTFIFLTPWQGLENGSFRILTEKGWFSLTAFTKIFGFFPLKVLECWQYRKSEKIWFYTKTGKKTQKNLL